MNTANFDSTFIRSCEDGERHLEVRVGNVETHEGGRQVFGAVARADTDIAVLIHRSLEVVGRTADTAVTAFLLAMRLQHAKQAASGLSSEEPGRMQGKAAIVAEVEPLRWRIWNGKATDAQLRLERTARSCCLQGWAGSSHEGCTVAQAVTGAPTGLPRLLLRDANGESSVIPTLAGRCPAILQNASTPSAWHQPIISYQLIIKEIMRNEANCDLCLNAVSDLHLRRITVFIKTWRIAIPATLAMTLSAGAALAAPLPSRPILTLEAARTVAAAAEARAKAEGWPCVISVVDSDGLPIILERMDNAAVLAGVELAPGKARTAALFRRETGVLEDAVNGKRPAAATARGFVLMRGGVPITVDGQIVGAIGVSADIPDHDELIAKAGVAALSR